jgi:hypothetical protein
MTAVLEPPCCARVGYGVHLRVTKHGWARGDDDRWPCFLEERQAVSWMRDRLTRGRVFV